MLSCVGRGLCDELITCPKESYHLIKKPKMGGQDRVWAVKATDKDEDDDILYNKKIWY
jgi:hypothetical protein